MREITKYLVVCIKGTGRLAMSFLVLLICFELLTNYIDVTWCYTLKTSKLQRRT